MSLLWCCCRTELGTARRTAPAGWELAWCPQRHRGGFVTNKTTSRNRRQARALRDRADAESVVKRRRADRSATWPSTNKYKVTANHSPHGPSAECVTPPVPVTALASLRPSFKGAVLKRPATELRCPRRRNPASWSPHLHSPTKPAAHRRAPRVSPSGQYQPVLFKHRCAPSEPGPRGTGTATAHPAELQPAKRRLPSALPQQHSSPQLKHPSQVRAPTGDEHMGVTHRALAG